VTMPTNVNDIIKKLSAARQKKIHDRAVYLTAEEKRLPKRRRNRKRAKASA
jgi:hypothetical protein